jgi:tRNA nucleotidyltransferase/poly(A) polymerase
MELFKLLVARHALGAIEVMTQCGLLDRVLGGVPLLASFGKMIEIEAALSMPADSIQRLGALGVFVVEDADRLRQRLRTANVEYERLASMADGWWRASPARGEQWARVLLYWLGREHYTERVLLAWARSPQSAADTSWHALATLPERWPIPSFPLRAADFIGRGVPKGRKVGAALAAAEQAWVAAGFPLDSTALTAIADAASEQAPEAAH